MTTSAILGQVPRPGRVSSGSILLDGQELVRSPERQMRAIRGRDIGTVFQDPMMALSPVHKVGDQMIEGLVHHEGISRKQAMERAAELLDLVGVVDARNRLNDYPHQFSGGMAQRAMIAAALICKPKLLIADEPTTALDVTVQKQVLDLLLQLRETLACRSSSSPHDPRRRRAALRPRRRDERSANSSRRETTGRNSSPIRATPTPCNSCAPARCWDGPQEGVR